MNKLKESIPLYGLPFSSSAVIAAGATNLKQLASSPGMLHGLRLAYAVSIRNALIFALAAACAAFPFACSMQWLNIKSIAQERLESVRTENNITERIAESQKSRQSLDAAVSDGWKLAETDKLKA